MKQHYLIRIILCVLAFLAIPAAFVSSQIMSYQLHVPQLDKEISYIRYQINDQQFDGWTIVKAEESLIQLDQYDLANDVLYMQQSKDGVIWSKSSKVRYSLDEGRWVLVLEEDLKEQVSPRSSLDIWGSYIMPQGRYANYYQKAFGGGIQVNNALERTQNLILFASIQYSYGFSESIWIDEFHEISAAAGLGSVTPLTSRLTLQTDIGAGAMVHVLNGDIHRKGTPGMFVFTDALLHLTPRLVLQLDQYTTITAAPRASLVIGNKALGTLVEVQIGTRIGL